MYMYIAASACFMYLSLLFCVRTPTHMHTHTHTHAHTHTHTHTHTSLHTLGPHTQALLEAHFKTSLILGEPFKHDRIFDFSDSDAMAKIHQMVPTILSHRLTPPPEESYSILRKYSGAFLLCSKLGAAFNCHKIFQKIYNQYEFSI